MALLPENVDAEPRLVVQRIAAIARPTREVIIDQPPISLHQGERDLLGLIRCERYDRRLDVDRLQFAKILDLHRMAHRKIQVRDAVVGLQHRG